ncbi:MFS transporter [Saccharomonospora sp. NPDC006951]
MRQPRNRWGLVGWYALLGAANQLLWLSFASVTTTAARRYEVSEEAIGRLAELFPLAFVLLALPVGALLDRLPRAALAAGALLTAAGGLVRLVGDDYGMLLTGGVLAALAQPVVLCAVNKVASGYLAPGQRPLGIAIGTAGTFLGMIAALGLGAVFSTEEGIPALVAIGAVWSAIAAAGVLAGLFATPPFAAEREPLPWRVALRRAAAGRRMRALCGVVFLGFGVFIALTTWLQVLLEPAGADGEATGTMLVTMLITGLVASVILPPVVARTATHRRLVRTAGVVTSLCCVLLALVPGLATGFLALVPLGLVLLPALPVVLELAEHADYRVTASAAGLIWLSGNAGGVVLAFAAGALHERPGVVFAGLAVVAALAVPVASAIGATGGSATEQVNGART